jgi:tRNA modification GTPase
MATIFAVSSGRPPAAIAVIRCSGPHAFGAVTALAGSLPPARTASLRSLRGGDGGLLDAALLLCFPGPASATGEDLVELHCHGGQAVIAAVECALLLQPGVRRAEPGEFTRRALLNGRIDVLEAEGLADLLEAETEAQRVAAIAAVEGQLGRQVRSWMERVAVLSARVEAMLDYAEEGGVATDDQAGGAIRADMAILAEEIATALATPSVERLREGIRVVLAGPPNAGKSTLLNALAERDAAIVSPIAGTTRDRIEVPVARAGLPFILTDTAGLADTDDPVEAIGVARAGVAIDAADLLVWLGDDRPPRSDAIWVHARADLPGREGLPDGKTQAISSRDAGSITALWTAISLRAAALVPMRGGAVPMRQRQRDAAAQASEALGEVHEDLILVAEALAVARRSFARLLGLDATETMLDALFSRFCLGK